MQSEPTTPEIWGAPVDLWPRRKEVAPDDERPASGAPRRDTTPTQASEPGVTDGLTENDIVTVAEQALLYADHMAGEGVVFDDGKVCLDPSEFMLAFYDQIGRTETETGDAARLIAGELRRLYRAEASSAAETSRLRAVEAEQAARIAALEAGLRRLHGYARWQIDEGNGHHPTLPSAVAETARLLNLPQEGR